MKTKDKTPAPPAGQETLRLPQGLPAGWTPTPEEGLSSSEAARRLAEGQGNRQTADAGKSVGRIVAENLFTLFNLLNFALALCLALVGSWRNMLFMGVVFSNTLIGTVQSLRARAMLRRLRLLQESPAHPIRDGEETDCPPGDLVLGDLVVFRAGDQLPADAIVRSGACAADESLLTGESDPVPHQAGDWLMSGSFLTEGKVTAQLAAVGDEAYSARLMREAKRIKAPKSELMTELNRLVAWISRLLVPLGLLMFVKQVFWLHDTVRQAVPTAVAAMIGMIPEGLILLTSVALMAGVIKLGGRKTLVQELFGIETLARVDVLCLDKTGTLTTGEMTLERLLPLEAEEAELREKGSRFLAAFEAGSGTLRALAAGLDPVEDSSLATLPFSSARKKSAAAFPDGTVLILGAPSFVLSRIPQQAEAATAQGFRVLVLAEAEGCIEGECLPPVKRTLGLFLLRDTLRPDAGKTLLWFREQGVQVRIMSGDDPRTVSAVAGMLGLPGADKTVDCGALDDDGLRSAARDRVIFGRLTPARKKILVDALKKEGHTVAMTGDGVNDIPSLKASDCSIAMGDGAEATRNAAQLVLLSSDFNALPEVVAEGRRVIGNITRTATLFLVKTLYSFALTVLLLFLPLHYPFQPIQLTLVSSLTIGAPSFFLALEPRYERSAGHFLRRVLLSAVPGAAAVTVCAAAAMVLTRFGLDYAIASTLATLTAGIVGLANLVLTCRPFSPLRRVVCITMCLLFAGAVALFPGLFYLEIAGMGLQNWLTLGILTAVALTILLVLTRLLRPKLQALTGRQ